MIEKKRGLGRGLDQLLTSSDWLKRDDVQLFYCPVDRLIPNPYQPRQLVDDEQMDELVRSIREKGVLQPILATRTQVPEEYQILAGERRWRASKIAGLTEVPILVREASSTDVLELALIENIQRQDLNCIEEALAYQRLQEEFHLTQEEISQRVGKNRSTVANLLRLLHLPPDIQEDLLNQRLTMGHARALLAVAGADEQRKLRDLILDRHLSVRQTEALVAKKDASSPQAKPEPDPRWISLQETLQSHLGSPVALRRRGQRGTLTISFGSEDELTRILDRIGVNRS
ncbi:ParB/RepB/Spo0J family partition protein [Desulforhabdus amnigena]|uniref:Chromosome partitioning protein ParB n=1 Tax=Desulforhabdus amnigena TaxID=40218 RepID=A0A9W6L9W9_9BACT|nr:ParB/RepB/Spo0J family partition protein [Desulforhabdus amnigena]GLI35595.1 chromosome partitioning protein ParB [Desulforhabdus amnigena]